MSSPKFEFLDFSDTNEGDLKELIHLIKEKCSEIDVPAVNCAFIDENVSVMREREDGVPSSVGEFKLTDGETEDDATTLEKETAVSGLSFFIDGGTAEDIDLEKTPPFPSSAGTPSLCDSVPDQDDSQSEANAFNPAQPPYMNAPTPTQLVHPPVNSHGVPSHMYHVPHAYPPAAPSDQPSALPGGMYQHIPAPAGHHPSAPFPHTVHIENCHVNLSPYGNHQHPAAVYAHHAQHYQHPSMYQPYIVADQSGVPMHVKPNAEKDFDHKRPDVHSRNIYNRGGRGVRGRGGRRGRDDNERSNSVSSDHSSYSDSGGGKGHYKESIQPHPPAPSYPMIFRYPSAYLPYNPITRSHGYSMLHQSPQYYHDPYAHQASHHMHYSNGQTPASITMIPPAEGSSINYSSPHTLPDQQPQVHPHMSHHAPGHSIHNQVPVPMDQSDQISISTHSGYLAHQSAACQFTYSNNENTVVIEAYAATSSAVPEGVSPSASAASSNVSNLDVSDNRESFLAHNSTPENSSYVKEVLDEGISQETTVVSKSGITITDPSTNYPVVFTKAGNTSLKTALDGNKESHDSGQLMEQENGQTATNNQGQGTVNSLDSNKEQISDKVLDSFVSPDKEIQVMSSPAGVVNAHHDSVLENVPGAVPVSGNTSVNKSRKKSNISLLANEFIYNTEDGATSNSASMLSFMDPIDPEITSSFVANSDRKVFKSTYVELPPKPPKTNMKGQGKSGKTKGSQISQSPTPVKEMGKSTNNENNVENHMAKLSIDREDKGKSDIVITLQPSNTPQCSSSEKSSTENLTAALKPETKKIKSPPPDIPEFSSKQSNVAKAASRSEIAWVQPKSWSHLLKSSVEFPNKQVAFVTPFNAKESIESSSDKPHNGVVNGDLSSACREEEKMKIGAQLKKYKPYYHPVHVQPRGLINKNYWCYANAPLQALLACPSFLQLTRSLKQEGEDVISSTSTPFISSLVEFAQEFSPMSPVNVKGRKERGAKKEPEITPGPPFEPTCIYKMLTKANEKHFMEGRQQDAEEMLSFVLNGLHDEMVECLKLAGVTSSSSEQQNGTLPEGDENDASQEEWRVQGPKRKGCCVTRVAAFHDSPVSHVFWGQLRSVLQQGGNTTANLQPFNTLPLDIQSPKVDTLKEALSQLVSKEEITGFTCPKTNQEVTASNQVMLEDLPRVLILQLKRFVYRDGGLHKVTKRLQFPVDLDLTKDLISANRRGKFSPAQRRYRLFAVVNHEGKEATKGHYVADVHHSGYRCWLRFDDATVTAIPEATVLKHEPPRVPYLLFYGRADTFVSSSSSSGPHGAAAAATAAPTTATTVSATTNGAVLGVNKGRK